MLEDRGWTIGAGPVKFLCSGFLYPVRRTLSKWDKLLHAQIKIGEKHQSVLCCDLFLRFIARECDEILGKLRLGGDLDCIVQCRRNRFYRFQYEQITGETFADRSSGGLCGYLAVINKTESESIEFYISRYKT